MRKYHSLKIISRESNESLHARIYNTGTVMIALKRLQKQRISRSFQKWCQVCTYVRMHRDRTIRLVRRYVSRWIRSRLLTSFRTWQNVVHAHVEQSRVCRHVIKGWIRRRIRGAFLKWHDFTETQRHNRLLLLRVIKRMTSRKVGAAWNVWISTCGDSRKKKLRAFLQIRVSYLYRRCTLQRAMIALLRDANSRIRGSSNSSTEKLREMVRSNIVKQLLVHLRHSHRYTLKEAFHRLHVHWHSRVLKSSEDVKMKRLAALKRFQRKHHISVSSKSLEKSSDGGSGVANDSGSDRRRRRSLLLSQN